LHSVGSNCCAMIASFRQCDGRKRFLQRPPVPGERAYIEGARPNESMAFLC
jgi:hypothetical protein